MLKDYRITNEAQIDYEILKLMKEHSKKYLTAPDKKEFLKNVCAYEQKLILLNSNNPYEVLCYLEQIDKKSSRLVLDELTFFEVLKILPLFKKEEKEKFYKSFSNLNLVNKFISLDDRATDYVDDLSYDRRVDLINSSKAMTSEASEIVYESIPLSQRDDVMGDLTSSSGISTLSSVDSYREDVISETNEASDSAKKAAEDSKKAAMEAQLNYLQDKERKERIGNKRKKAINEFLKNNIERLKLEYPELGKIDSKQEDIYSSMTPELRRIIRLEFHKEKRKRFKQSVLTEKNKMSNLDNKTPQNLHNEQLPEINHPSNFDKNKQVDIEFYKKYSIIGNGENFVSIISNPSIKESFEQVKDNCEKQIINNLQNKLSASSIVEENTKTI